jgi:hypothetical protein
VPSIGRAAVPPAAGPRGTSPPGIDGDGGPSVALLFFDGATGWRTEKEPEQCWCTSEDARQLWSASARTAAWFRGAACRTRNEERSIVRVDAKYFYAVGAGVARARATAEV